MEQYDVLLTVVVPVYNEGQVLPQTIPNIVHHCEKNGWRVIFVNDGSKDDTENILNEYCNLSFVQVLHHKVNRGYGGAIKTGIQTVQTPFLITIDADGQHNLIDVKKLLDFAIENNADMVVGNRGKSGDINFYRAIGKRLIRIFARIFVPVPIQDLNSGFKLYRTELAKKYITVCPNSMSFSDVITLVFINQRDLVLEHPIAINPRQAGQSTINIYTALETIFEILNIVLLFFPLKVFLPISAFLILLGFGWGTTMLIINQQGVSVGAMLAIVTGLIFFILGLLANQISAIRMEKLSLQ